jgi:hypothetical protein
MADDWKDEEQSGGSGQGLTAEEETQRDKIQESDPIQEESEEFVKQPWEPMEDEHLNPPREND